MLVHGNQGPGIQIRMIKRAQGAQSVVVRIFERKSGTNTMDPEKSAANRQSPAGALNEPHHIPPRNWLLAAARSIFTKRPIGPAVPMTMCFTGVCPISV